MLAAAPGPDNMYVLALSMSRGAKAACVLAAGLISGVIVHTLICAAGISILIVNSPKAFLCVKILGALYLGYLAISALRENPTENAKAAQSGKFSETSQKKLYLRGFMMNVLNPKVMLFFLALLPQFTRENADFAFWLQILVLARNLCWLRLS